MPTGRPLKMDAALNLIPEDLDRNQDISLAARDVLVNELHCGTCDLHLHTTASDGSDGVGDLLKRAMDHRLHTIAVTDRDTMAGVSNMLILLEKLYKLEVKGVPNFIRGIEISTQGFDQPLDLLAYFPIEGSGPLMSFLEEQRQSRHARNREMCQRLQARGLPITIEELEAEGPHVVGRLHAANILVRKGYALTKHEAFLTWLDVGRPGYVPYVAPPIEQVIQSVRQAHGVPVLSNPSRYGWLGRSDECLMSRLAYLKDHGLLGLEVVMGGLNEAQLDESAWAARQLGLTATCGSGYIGYDRRNINMFKREMDFSRWIP